MQAVLHPYTISPIACCIGRIMSAIPVLLLLVAGVVGVSSSEEAIASSIVLGYPGHVTLIIAAVELVCLVLYLIPRTSVLGAILLTGYLGGAVATHVRMLDMDLALKPFIVGILLWGWLYLRNPQLRALIPIRL
ncbi:MAG: DoxX family protein [Chloroflexaceae bacterium]|nr:DoxX family protein [Chloroflexaceae bacterium]